MAKQYAISCLAMTMLAGAALGDDLNPPPWRGAPGSTFQHWTFPAALPFGPPDVFHNPAGLPLMTPGATAAYLPVFNNREGVWCLPPDGSLEFHVPNFDKPDMEKLIWIQVTWFAGTPLPGAGMPLVEGFGSNGAPFIPLVNPETNVLPDGWFHTTWKFRLDYCPPYETIRISSGDPTGTLLYIDQVVIDTICIPSAGAETLAFAGMVVLARRRRRS